MAVRITTDQLRELEAPTNAAHERDLDALRARLTDRKVDTDAVITEVQRFSVAAPSWALGTGGTRFGRFPGGGEPRTTEEKLDDVAALNAITGANRTVSLHVPWDESDRVILTSYPPFALLDDTGNMCRDGSAGMEVFSEFKITQKAALSSSWLADKLDQIMKGEFQPVTDALIEHDRNQLRGEMVGLDV